MAALAVGLIFCGEANEEAVEAIYCSLMERDEV
jgi:hypothetical protein